MNSQMAILTVTGRIFFANIEVFTDTKNKENKTSCP